MSCPNEELSALVYPVGISESRRRLVEFVFRRKALARMERDGSSQQAGLGLPDIWVRHAALDGTHSLAGFITMKANALRTQFWIDDKDLITLGDRLVGAFRLTSAAVDTFVSDISGHANFLHVSSRAASKPPG